ncbi:hypothetical protein Lal_00016657 [Lupinus albus]|nr:hypothetical protein Lal_00016657 [Lupinus albus]
MVHSECQFYEALTRHQQPQTVSDAIGPHSGEVGWKKDISLPSGRKGRESWFSPGLGNGSKGDDLCLYPNEVIVADGSREFAKYTTLRSWVQQWLNYVKWYYMVVVSPGVTIQDLLDAPFVESSDSQLVWFGLVWKASLLYFVSPAKHFLYVMFCELNPFVRANLAYRSCKPIVPFGLTPEGCPPLGSIHKGPHQGRGQSNGEVRRGLFGPLLTVELLRSLPFQLNSWYRKITKGSKRPSFLGVLWYPRVRYCFDENELFSQMDMASFEKEVIPNDPRGMVGRFVSLNPATSLAPSDIRSMVRSLVICLTHASEVRGGAKCLSAHQVKKGIDTSRTRAVKWGRKVDSKLIWEDNKNNRVDIIRRISDI